LNDYEEIDVSQGRKQSLMLLVGAQTKFYFKNIFWWRFAIQGHQMTSYKVKIMEYSK